VRFSNIHPIRRARDIGRWIEELLEKGFVKDWKDDREFVRRRYFCPG